jgi:peptidoglycan/LPS O-acetylase OafA/YrhL
MMYRPDIDGLRAVAVLAVLIFHAFPTLLPGGFVGVDIFFVISGYLITGIVLRDVAQGRFSLGHFYAQRVRRIFPALIAVLVFCLAVGWVALTSGEYKQLGRYTAGGAAFLNNVLFWRDAGYFDNEADTKPLLHLWSLAIEEQFYLAWPLLLMLLAWVLRDVGRSKITRYAAWLLALLWLASLGFSLWQVGSDAVGNFYSPLSRAWELLLGAALAVHAQRVTVQGLASQQSAFKRNVIAWLGLALIALSLCVIHPKLAFPGAWALLPTLGATCLIYAGAAASVNRWLLANPVMVWIGLISYPLYLWHWPLLSFARIFEAQTPSVLMRLCLLLASVGLAYATYRFIERPVRFGSKRPAHARAVLWLLSLLMLGLLFGGYAINRLDGLKFRHHGRLNADASSIVIGADRASLVRSCGLASDQMAGVEWCLSQAKAMPPGIAVVGDSKAEALYYGLAREAPVDAHVILMGSMRLADAVVDANQPRDRMQRARIALDRIKNDKAIEWVILSNTLVHVVSANKKGLIEQDAASQSAARTQLALWHKAYSSLLGELNASSKRVMLVIDNPTLPDPNSCIEGDLTPFAWLNRLLYRQVNPDCKLPLKTHMDGTQLYRDFFVQLAQEHSGVQVFDTVPLLCDNKAGVCNYFEGRRFLYSYGNHISDVASSKIAHQLWISLLR